VKLTGAPTAPNRISDHNRRDCRIVAEAADLTTATFSDIHVGAAASIASVELPDSSVFTPSVLFS
jgi:hypothetical protein